MTDREKEFLDQMARKKMVEWCDMEIRIGSLKMEATDNPYFLHAISKGWVSKDGSRVLSAGWQTATRFLKR